MFSFRLNNTQNIVCNAYYANRSFGPSYISAFGPQAVVEDIAKQINSRPAVIARRMFQVDNGNFKVITNKVPNSDYLHFVAYKEDYVYKDAAGNETLFGHFFIKSEEELYLGGTYDERIIDSFYDKLYKLSPLPVLKDWSSYLIDKMRSERYIWKDEGESDGLPYILNSFMFRIRVSDLQRFISEGLETNEIFIDRDNNGTSEIMSELTSLDLYLEHFSEQLAKRIQDSFVPYFVHGEEYDEKLNDLVEYGDYFGKLKLYDAQKSVAQAVSNSLDKNKRVFIIGEQGVGKTSISISSTLLHNKDKKFMTNIIMCPGHLVEKWKREVERLAPLSEAVIVDSFEKLLEMTPKIKDRNRKNHLWLVMSKESAKFGYQKRPAAIWREIKPESRAERGCYCCPECGEPLFEWKFRGTGSRRYRYKSYFGKNAFEKENVSNHHCINTHYVTDENGEKKQVECGCHLWQALTKWEAPCEYPHREENWVKLGKAGWIERKFIQSEYDRLSKLDKMEKEDVPRFEAYYEFLEGEKFNQVAPKKYSLGKYIRRFFKGYIDYALMDEIHELKGKDSLQGNAFGSLIATAKRSICFTGTLLNGYATGIFYILFRAFPGMMKKAGFTFDNKGEMEFMRQFGVYKQTSTHRWTNRLGSQLGSAKVKQLPGVSPIVFTNFLLENAAFISLEDIGAGLPGYEEIPIPVEMDAELANAYRLLQPRLGNVMGGGRGRGFKTMGQMLVAMSAYPDQPYDQPPIIHPDTGQTVLSLPDLNKDTLRNKESRLIELVEEARERGEKVLVYYSWTNRTEVGDKLPRLLEERGIRARNLTTNINNRQREAWIKKELDNGLEILFCNPSLVETGLDLLDFTTIIYYQVGYNLFTMRQSSRRSWRLSQTKDVKVYFLYYKDTIQEMTISLMATKLQAAMAIEGKFSEEGLNAMSNNEDLLTQIANNVVEGMSQSVDVDVFSKGKINSTQIKEENKTRLIDSPPPKPIQTLLERKKKEKTKLRFVTQPDEDSLSLSSVLAAM